MDCRIVWNNLLSMWSRSSLRSSPFRHIYLGNSVAWPSFRLNFQNFVSNSRLRWKIEFKKWDNKQTWRGWIILILWDNLLSLKWSVKLWSFFVVDYLHQGAKFLLYQGHLGICVLQGSNLTRNSWYIPHCYIKRDS